MKRLLNTALKRIVVVGIFMVIQLAFFVAVFFAFMDYILEIYIVSILITICVILYIVNSESNPAYKIAWIIPILVLPIFGVLFYLLYGRNYLSERTRMKFLDIQRFYSDKIGYMDSDFDKLKSESFEASIQSRYIMNTTGVGPYLHTESEFIPSGEIMLERLTEELKKAKRFIYMEYFIIDMGYMWDEILKILEIKAQEGLDIRVIYDDFGSLTFLPHDYDEILEKKGIKACVFNKFTPWLTIARLNNRDHRKICVIDGNVGFTGGINIADKYINRAKRKDHWLDSGVMIKGKGVWSMSVMFLSMWDFLRKEKSDYHICAPDYNLYSNIKNDGYVQPYTDTPLDFEAVGENVYMNMINRAKEYVYISTPYLIIDNEMITALCNAAKSGVEIILTTPKESDSKIVSTLTHSYYKPLVSCGVKIYEYQDGIIHSKNFICDDKYAVVGTINLDYRSLYLHYECGIWLYNASSIASMKSDYLNILSSCRQVSIQDCENVRWYKKLIWQILRLIAPLL